MGLPRLVWIAFIVLLLSIYMCSCSTAPPERVPKGRDKPYKVFGEKYYPLLSSKGYQETGIASWYGNDFHGKRTSNGEVYDMYANTAAHKTLPFDTIVKVTNLENGKDILVRINDRGPFVKNRIIDLSLKGARDLGILNKGTALVKIEALGKQIRVVEGGKLKIRYEQPENYDTGNFTIQVGAFVVWENANRLKERLAWEYENAHIVKYDNGDEVYYRVRITHASTLQSAMHTRDILESRGFKDAFVVAD